MNKPVVTLNFHRLTVNFSDYLNTSMSVAFADNRPILDVRPVQLAPGEIRIGANCYTRHVDRADGLPEIAVNFSGEDPQGFCKGLTISHVLLGAGRWMRDEG